MKTKRTYYYGVGYLGFYINSIRSRLFYIDDKNITKIRAYTIKEARQIARESRR